MASLDSFLNFIIPLGAVLFFGFIMYKAIGPELRRFGRWIKSFFDEGEAPVETGPQIGGTIVYTK